MDIFSNLTSGELQVLSVLQRCNCSLSASKIAGITKRKLKSVNAIIESLIQKGYISAGYTINAGGGYRSYTAKTIERHLAEVVSTYARENPGFSWVLFLGSLPIDGSFEFTFDKSDDD